MEFVNEFHKTMVHILQVLNTQPTIFSLLAYSLPSNQAVCTVTFFFSGTKESSSFSIEQFLHTFQ